MSKEQVNFAELVKHEESIYGVMVLLIPLAIFSFVISYDNYTTNEPDALALHWFMPLLYIPIFYYIYNRKQFKLKREQKNIKTFFEKIGFEKAVVRYTFLAKIYKYSIIAMLVIGVLGIFGFQAILFAMDESITSYKNQEKVYKTELQKIISMNEDELREYYKNIILYENNNVLDQWLLGFFMNADEEQAKILEHQYDVELSKASSKNKIERLTDNEKRAMMIPIIDSLSYEDIKSSIDTRLNMLKPSEDTENIENFKTLELLVSIMMIPTMMVYVNFVFNPKRIDYFQYYFALGAFRIVQNTTSTEIEKRKYMTIGLDGYDQFLKETLRMKINSMDAIKSAILVQNSEKLIKTGESFEKILTDNGQLQLVELLGNQYRNDKNLPLLIPDSNQERIRNYFTILIPTATTIIAIISLIIKS